MGFRSRIARGSDLTAGDPVSRDGGTTMTPKFAMPVMRQLPRDTDRPLWRRLLGLWEPIVYELAEPYTHTVWIDGRPVNILLPAGFRSDLASTPSFTWVFGFRPDGVLMIPGLIHDWYYRHGYLLTDKHETICQDRGKLWADKLLASLTARISGVKTPGILALIALAICGWPAWHHNARYREAAERTGKVQLKGDYDG